MFKIGITGSIGTGKTTIAKAFTMLKLPLFDADYEVKNLLNEKKIINKIKKVWPDTVEYNSINKKKLKKYIFLKDLERTKLENIIHPALNIKKTFFNKKNKKKLLVVYDIPLIYETKSQKLYDLIILANCSEKNQKERVLRRDKIDEKLFKKIKNSQFSFKKKMEFNPKLINTDKSRIIVYMEVMIFVLQLLIKLKIKNVTRKKINLRY
mgnify:CR=1 FL=1